MPAASHDRPTAALDRRLLWLLPLAFIVHDGEELATMPAWLAAHGDTASGLLPRMPGLSEGSLILAMDRVQLMLAMGAILLLLTSVTAAVSLSRSKVALHAYGFVLGGFFLHGFGHLAQALLLRGYTPGVVTAALVVIPVSLFVYRTLWKSGALSRTATWVLAVAGAALVAPAILLALSVGRALGR
jgi:hypothetical protein